MTLSANTSQDSASLAKHCQLSLKAHLAPVSNMTADASVYKLVIFRVPYASSTSISTFHAAMKPFSNAVFYHGADQATVNTAVSPDRSACWQYSTLILLLQRSSHPELKWMSLCGLKAIESSGGQRGTCPQHEQHHPAFLCPSCDAISYIQYIDTTGHTQPRALQSRLTKGILTGYYHFLMDRSKTLSLATAACQWLAWYATGHENQTEQATHGSSSPLTSGSLLWSGSHKNPNKNSLHGKSVSAWWSRWIAASQLDRHQVWCYSPGAVDDDIVASREASDDMRRGFPFDPSSRALATVPLFPDDPVTRHLEALEVAVPLTAPATPSFPKKSESRKEKKAAKAKVKPGLTVRELMASLTFRSEYRNGAGTHYYMKLNHRTETSNTLDSAAHDPPIALASKQPAPDKSTMWSLDDWISTTMHGLEFGSFKAALQSTAELLNEIDKLQRDTLDQSMLLVQELDFSDLPPTAHQADSTFVVQNEKPIERESLRVMNDVQSLVKRRKT